MILNTKILNTQYLILNIQYSILNTQYSILNTVQQDAEPKNAEDAEVDQDQRRAAPWSRRKSQVDKNLQPKNCQKEQK